MPYEQAELVNILIAKEVANHEPGRASRDGEDGPCGELVLGSPYACVHDEPEEPDECAAEGV